MHAASFAGEWKWWGFFGAFAFFQVLPNQDIWTHLSSLGLGGIIFFFYRQDRRDSEARYSAMVLDIREETKATEHRYSAIALEHTNLVKENTQALTQLTVLLHARVDDLK
jgi:hypothetical protein